MEKIYFESIVQAFKENNEERFNANVRNWMDMDLENPYPTNTKEHRLYFGMKSAWRDWRGKTINMRSAKQRMLRLARELMQENMLNPYIKEESKILEEPLQLPTEEPVETPVENTVETVVETPAETPTETVADTQAETVTETTVEAPVETIVDTPAEAVVDTPAVVNHVTQDQEYIFGVLPRRRKRKG